MFVPSVELVVHALDGVMLSVDIVVDLVVVVDDGVFIGVVTVSVDVGIVATFVVVCSVKLDIS